VILHGPPRTLALLGVVELADGSHMLRPECVIPLRSPLMRQIILRRHIDDVDPLADPPITTDLVHLDQTICPDDGTRLQAYVMHEPALFKHGGYGATRRTVVLSCPACGWGITAEVSEISPNHHNPGA
jgi:hypothetical protein